jgi:hypothetical protein
MVEYTKHCAVTELYAATKTLYASKMIVKIQYGYHNLGKHVLRKAKSTKNENRYLPELRDRSE